MHSLWFFSCTSFYIYLHLISYCILSLIAQSFTILSLTELDRIQPCGSQLGFDEQTAKSSKHLRCSSMNHPHYRLARDLQPVLNFSLSTKLKDCQCHQDCHPHVSSQTLGFSNHIQDFRKCSCSTTTGETGSNGSLMTWHCLLHSHRKDSKGKHSSSCSTWMAFVSYTFLLHWPESHW